MSNRYRIMYQQVQRLKLILVNRSTGQYADSEEFEQLRLILLAETSIKDRLPDFLSSCRTLVEFWGFIQPKFETYKERREYLRQQFDPPLTYLENLLRQSPVDRAANSVLNIIDVVNVRDAWDKALERRDRDPEGAITTARTLLEAVCKYILDEAGISYNDRDDLPKLYKLTAEQLNLSPAQHSEQVFKQILGGVTSVVDGLGAMRNRLSDAHGKGKRSVKPTARHAQLAVNLAGAVSAFLLETWENKKPP